MSATVGIIVFPGSNCEQDVKLSFEYLGADPQYVWHLETDLSRFDVLVLPGGFSYGDYLRTGAIAAYSPVMRSVREFAASGRPVIGICNGFQILCEAGILPGALRRNTGLKFKCAPVFVKVATARCPFTSRAPAGGILRIPINHFEGNYFCPADTLAQLYAEDRIALKYCDPRGRVTSAANPNGAADNIAGVLSPGRNVLGLMPHPERAVDPALGGVDGAVIFPSMLGSMVAA